MPHIERIGLGFDSHRTAPGRRLVLGGIEVPSPFGLVGHSDGDVVLHAVIDALLGAAGLPDIGELFPDNDPQYRDIDSRTLLRDALRHVEERGWTPVNLDLTIHAEQPRLRDHKPAIRDLLASLLGLEPDAVAVKAKTGEGVGPIGRGEALACHVVVGLAKGV